MLKNSDWKNKSCKTSPGNYMKRNTLTTKLLQSTALILLGFCISCSNDLGSGRHRYTTDKEICVYVDVDSQMSCTNMSLSEKRQHYNREIRNGDIVTNAYDFTNSISELMDLIGDLKACEAGL